MWWDWTMVDVAQLVEPRIVIPVVVGSSPIVHPNPCSTAEVFWTGTPHDAGKWAASSIGRAADS